jgi:hypothetical protein
VEVEDPAREGLFVHWDRKVLIEGDWNLNAFRAGGTAKEEEVSTVR